MSHQDSEQKVNLSCKLARLLYWLLSQDGQCLGRVWFSSIHGEDFERRLNQQLAVCGYVTNSARLSGTNYILVRYGRPLSGAEDWANLVGLVNLIVDGFKKQGGLRRIEFTKPTQKGFVIERCQKLGIKNKPQADDDGCEVINLGLADDVLEREDIYYSPSNWIGEPEGALLYPGSIYDI